MTALAVFRLSLLDCRLGAGPSWVAASFVRAGPHARACSGWQEEVTTLAPLSDDVTLADHINWIGLVSLRQKQPDLLLLRPSCQGSLLLFLLLTEQVYLIGQADGDQ